MDYGLPKEIENLKKLKKLNLEGIKFNEREKDRIRKLLPHAEIRF